MGDTVSHAVLPGVVLDVAMLIIPGATAHLLTDRFGRMLLIAPTISVFASVTGGRTRQSTVMPCSAQKDISRGSASEMLGDEHASPYPTLRFASSNFVAALHGGT